MNHRHYHGQFAIADDLLVVTIPQREIIDAMIATGSQKALNDICLAVTVVVDAICTAQEMVLD
jgi:hypothetical protein